MRARVDKTKLFHCARVKLIWVRSSNEASATASHTVCSRCSKSSADEKEERKTPSSHGIIYVTFSTPQLQPSMCFYWLQHRDFHIYCCSRRKRSLPLFQGFIFILHFIYDDARVILTYRTWVSRRGDGGGGADDARWSGSVVSLCHLIT